MAGDLVLVDTSVWIEALRAGGDPTCQQHVDSLMAGRQVATCEVVVLEVLQGAQSAEHLARLSADLAATAVLGMEGAGDEAGHLAWSLRRRGLVIPTTDLLIAATARLHDVVLFHRDRHLAEAAAALDLRAWQP